MLLIKALNSKLKFFLRSKTFQNIKIVEKNYLKMFKRTMKLSFLCLVLFLLKRQILYFNTYQLEYVKNDVNNKLIEYLLPIDYIPTFYIPNCLLQMIYSEVKSSPDIIYRRQYLQTHDNAVISLDWVEKEDNLKTPHNISNKNKKILVILHGLTGGSESNYIKEIVDEYLKVNDMKLVVVNYRGINGTPLLNSTIYHAGYTEDIFTAMSYIKEQFPDLNCYILGASMGANIFTKMLAKHDDFNNYIKGFISISNPLNCYEVEKRNRGGVLDNFLKNRQIKYVQKHQQALKDIVDIDQLVKIKYYYQFDELVTLKIFNFQSVEDYYKQSSSLQDIEHIKVPSLYLNARDDKLSPIDTLDLENTFRKNPNVILILTRWGGHVCWFTENIKPRRWFISKSKKFIEALEEIQSEKRRKHNL